jgi:hypothetical protein
MSDDVRWTTDLGNAFAGDAGRAKPPNGRADICI